MFNAEIYFFKQIMRVNFYAICCVKRLSLSEFDFKVPQLAYILRIKLSFYINMKGADAYFVFL